MADLADLPFYNADVEQLGFPDAVKDFAAKWRQPTRCIFAVPEYNFSLSGVLKNALEWLSRPPNPPVNGKACGVFGASVSPLALPAASFIFVMSAFRSIWWS